MLRIRFTAELVADMLRTGRVHQPLEIADGVPPGYHLAAVRYHGESGHGIVTLDFDKDDNHIQTKEIIVYEGKRNVN